MKSSSTFLVFGVALTVVLTIPMQTTSAYGGAKFSASPVYQDPGRTFRETITRERWEGVAITPLKLSKSQSKDVMLGEVTSFSVKDCSNSDFRCITSARMLFAVPRKFLESTATYSFAGAKLKVVRCLRGEANHCQVAMIGSVCTLQGDMAQCGEADVSERVKPNYGPLLCFLYNEDYGVTAFGTAPDGIIDEATCDQVVAHMVLQGNLGLLGEKIK